MRIPKEYASKKWLDLPGYAAVLKENGIIITSVPVEYTSLIQLRDIRNAIAHHGGWVTEENEQRMSQYGYKVGDFVQVDDNYVRNAIVLTIESCKTIIDMSIPVFVKHFALSEPNPGQ